MGLIRGDIESFNRHGRVASLAANCEAICCRSYSFSPAFCAVSVGFVNRHAWVGSLLRLTTDAEDSFGGRGARPQCRLPLRGTG